MDMSSKCCASQQAAGYLMLFSTNPGLHDFTLFHCVISRKMHKFPTRIFLCWKVGTHTNRKEECGWDTFTDLQPSFDFLLLNLFSSLLVDTLLCLIACFYVFSCTDIFYWSLERSQQELQRSFICHPAWGGEFFCCWRGAITLPLLGAVLFQLY